MVDVLTGFKFIAEKIKQYESDGSKTFLFGFEESYGYLVSPFVRDKDAIQALVLIAEVAAYYKKSGDTLYDGLKRILYDYGYFKEKTISISMQGITGAEKIKALMVKFREESPKEFAGIAVECVEDFSIGKRTLQDGTVEEIDLPAADVLKYKLVDNSWIAVRPSGTEPKIKFYIGAFDDSGVEIERKVVLLEESINLFVNE
jgi:phosphoglucomutase